MAKEEVRFPETMQKGIMTEEIGFTVYGEKCFISKLGLYGGHIVVRVYCIWSRNT